MVATFAQHLSLYYNYYVNLSIRYQLVKMFITLEPPGILLSHFAYICMLTIPNHWHANLPVDNRYEFAVQLSRLLWSVSKTPYNS